MSTELDRIRESAEFVSDSAFRLLRLDMILIGIYLTVGGYLANLNSSLQQAIGESNYMVASVVFLFMSILAGYLTYESSSRLAAINMYDEPQEEYQKYNGTERLVFNLRYSVLLALLSGFTFGLGIIDGILPNGIGVINAGQVVFVLLFLTALPVISVHFGLRIVSRIRAFFSSA
jgi:hypothetical protein